MTQSGSQVKTSPAAVLIVGSLALDDIETPFGAVSNAVGGAAYYAATAASLYAPVRLVAAVGTDFAREHLDNLAGRGVDLEGTEIREGRTFRWSGRYEYDMSRAQTLRTEVNVFADFRPSIPASYRGSKYVFLANIDPELQLSVLDQLESPRLVAADTMNFWISNKRDAVVEVLRRVDVSLLNDAEVRQLCGVPGLVSAAKRLLDMGPKIAIVKKGEHGAAMFTATSCFSAPSYPLEEVRDPTGAGDSFAGALMGYLASQNDVSEPAMRRAIIHGSVVASFVVEDFGASRLEKLRREEIASRFRKMQEIVSFAPE